MVVGQELLALTDQDLRRTLTLEQCIVAHGGATLDLKAGRARPPKLPKVKARIELLMRPIANLASAEQSAEAVGERLGIDRRSVGFLSTNYGLKGNRALFDPRTKKYTRLGAAVLAVLHDARLGGVSTESDERLPSVRAQFLQILEDLLVTGARARRVEREACRRIGRDAETKKKRRKARRNRKRL